MNKVGLWFCSRWARPRAQRK